MCVCVCVILFWICFWFVFFNQMYCPVDFDFFFFGGGGGGGDTGGLFVTVKSTFESLINFVTGVLMHEHCINPFTAPAACKLY